MNIEHIAAALPLQHAVSVAPLEVRHEPGVCRLLGFLAASADWPSVLPAIDERISVQPGPQSVLVLGVVFRD